MSTSIAEPRWYSIGPHGFYDLVRLARRGRSSLVRVGYLLALFGVLAVVYSQTRTWEGGWDGPRRKIILDQRSGNGGRTESINTNARIAERFCVAILIMQNIAVLLLVPIYVASSVHEERDKRTLPMLFTTQLTAREIVLGKWLARVGQVGIILLGGLPILSFVQLWGGIDMPMIAANFVNTGCWLVSLGAFSMMMATQSRSVARSVVKTYLLPTLVFAVFLCCCMPTGFRGDLVFLLRPLDGPDGYWQMGIIVGGMAILHLAHAFFFLWRATHNLEMQRGDESMPTGVLDVSLEPVNLKHVPGLPPVSDDALVWKERYLGQAIWNPVAALVLPLILCILLGYLTVLLPVKHPDRTALLKQYHGVFAGIMLLCFGIYTLLVTYRLSGCIVREHERHTLDSLLTLPVTRTELLRAKIKGNLLRYWVWLLPASISWLILLFLSGRNPAGNILLLWTLAIHLTFFSLLGLFLSVVCRTSVVAYVSLTTTLLLLVIGTAIAPSLLGQAVSIEWWCKCLNPVGVWIAIVGERWEPVSTADPEIYLTGLAIYGVAAWSLWIYLFSGFGLLAGRASDG